MNRVHCDGCGQDIEIERLEDIEWYYEKPCENCGEILINDMDLEIALNLIELKRLGIVTEGSEEPSEGFVRTRISTLGGELRISEITNDEVEVSFAEDTSRVNENGKVE